MIPRTGGQADPDRVRRANAAVRGSRYSYTLPPESGTGSVAPLRALTATSSTSDVRAFVITVFRDMQKEGKLS